MKEKLSVVIPCYNSEKNIRNVIEKDIKIFNDNRIDKFEFVLVNDCSKDNTWNVLMSLVNQYPFVKAINLAKNCGQHGAIMAGFNNVNGDYIVVSDDDGQTQMEKIPEIMAKLVEGYDIVTTRWLERGKRSLFRRIGTYLTCKMNKELLGEPDDVSMSIFFVARRFVIEEVTKYRNPYPFITGLLLRTSHNIGVVDVEQLERQSGSSGYSFVKLLRLWLNGFTAFSIKPLRLATVFGCVSAIIGVIFGVFIIIRKIVIKNVMVGWTSTIAIMLLMFGVVLCVLGMIGEYIGRIYMCINNSPQYVIREVYIKENI